MQNNAVPQRELDARDRWNRVLRRIKMGQLHEYDWIERAEEDRPKRSGNWMLVAFWVGYGLILGTMLAIGVGGGAHYVGEQIKHWIR